MNTFQDNRFDFYPQGNLNLHYCGNRENSVDHKYVHRQNAYLLTLVVSGKACMTVGDRKLPLSAGDVYVMFPRSDVSYVTEPSLPWSIRWVTLTGTQLETMFPLLGFTPENPVVSTADSEEVERLLQELFHKTLKVDVKNKLSAMALLYELFSCLAQQRTAHAENPTVAEAVRYISRHYAEDITIRGLAERAYLNSNYFSKLFSTHTGLTPQQFIIRIRMEKAKELLQYTDLSVGEIAATVGFGDALYFSRAFKRYTAVSPQQYRAHHK